MTIIAPDAYAARCERAATDQGLDPLAAALDAADVRHTIEQTGGFCMVLALTVDDGTFVATLDGPDDNEWLTVFYPGDSWQDGEATGNESLHTGDLAETAALLIDAANR